MRLESQNYSLNPWAAGWMLCLQAWKQHESYCTAPSELMSDQVHLQWIVIFEINLFFIFWALDLNSRLKIFSKSCCKQMCCHPGCILQRQNTFTSILRNPRHFGFSFKSPVILAHNQRVSLSFETVRPSIVFSLTMKVLDGIFFKQRVILSTSKIYFFNVATIIHYFSLIWITCCNFYTNSFCFTLHFGVMVMAFFFKPHKSAYASF